MFPIKLDENMIHFKVQNIFMDIQAELKRDSFSTGFKHRLSLFNYPQAGTLVSVIIIVTHTFKQNLMLIFQTIVIIKDTPNLIPV